MERLGEDGLVSWTPQRAGSRDVSQHCASIKNVDLAFGSPSP
jgi:hypothetical protein